MSEDYFSSRRARRKRARSRQDSKTTLEHHHLPTMSPATGGNTNGNEKELERVSRNTLKELREKAKEKEKLISEGTGAILHDSQLLEALLGLSLDCTFHSILGFICICQFSKPGPPSTARLVWPDPNRRDADSKTQFLLLLVSSSTVSRCPSRH
jgi:hypothetical protein